MEKVNFRNSRGLNLAGVLHFPKQKTANAIIISHGFIANKDRVRFIKLAKSLNEMGFVVLRFDFSGCGESDKAPITIKNQVGDLKSAIAYLKKKGFSSISLIGHSLGGLVSLLVYDNKIKTIVLLAPVTKSQTPYIFRQKKFLKQIMEKGFLIYKRGKNNFKIPMKYLIERRKVNQKSILSKIKCSVLIVHGTKDDHIPLTHSKKALKYLPKGSKLEIIKNGDHKLDRKFDEVMEICTNWFKRAAQQ